jgi:hypothetical protein
MSESEEENLMSFDCVADVNWLELLGDEVNERLGQLVLTKSTMASIFCDGAVGVVRDGQGYRGWVGSIKG